MSLIVFFNLVLVHWNCDGFLETWFFCCCFVLYCIVLFYFFFSFGFILTTGNNWITLSSIYCFISYLVMGFQQSWFYCGPFLCFMDFGFIITTGPLILMPSMKLLAFWKNLWWGTSCFDCCGWFLCFQFSNMIITWINLTYLDGVLYFSTTCQKNLLCSKLTLLTAFVILLLTWKFCLLL